MYAQAYDTILGESVFEAKDKERQAFDHAIKLLENASGTPEDTRAKVDALLFTERLWSILLEDLAQPENVYSDELKGRLISIGIWILKEVVALRQGTVSSMNPLIEINQIIRDGLE